MIEVSGYGRHYECVSVFSQTRKFQSALNTTAGTVGLSSLFFLWFYNNVMLFKVNPTKQNIQIEQGALVTGICYVQLHTPLTDMRRFKVLIKQVMEKGKGRRGKIKLKHEWSLCERPVIKLLGTSLRQKRHTHTQPRRSIHTHTHQMITGPLQWRLW